MNKKEAIKNLKITGLLLITVGIIALLSVLYYYGKVDNITDSIFNLLFSIAMLYFGFLVLSSIKPLVR